MDCAESEKERVPILSIPPPKKRAADRGLAEALELRENVHRRVQEIRARCGAWQGVTQGDAEKRQSLQAKRWIPSELNSQHLTCTSEKGATWGTFQGNRPFRNKLYSQMVAMRL